METKKVTGSGGEVLMHQLVAQGSGTRQCRGWR